MNEYDGVLVPKAWGYEWCAFDNGAAAVWILHIASKRKTSLHCHPNKKTTLVVLAGSVYFHTIPGVTMARQLDPLDVVTIDKGVYHQTEACGLQGYPSAEDGAWLMEIEEPSNKGDLVRAEDAYGRAGQPYETEVVPYAGELLRLEVGFPAQFLGYTFTLQSTLGWMYKLPGLTLAMGASSDHILTITKDQTVKLSDYVADFIANLGIKHVFSVSGGGCMHLTDSVGRHERLTYVATHHEQAATMAAESYSRMNGLGCALVTTGPGGTNAITGVSCAWIDSIPLIMISGQVTRDTLLAETGLRQFGVQESDIVTMVSSITKYAVTVQDERDIKHVLQKAAYLATSGRPGPVWVDIPLDIQSKQINPDELQSFQPSGGGHSHPALGALVSKAMAMLRAAERPVLVVGNGVRLARAQRDIQKLADLLSIPIVTSWTAADMIGERPLHIGHCGIFGDRASNFAVQNADLLLVIGCRLSVPQMGYNGATFARGAKIIMVDVDDTETRKPSLLVDLPIIADAQEFIQAASLEIEVNWAMRPLAFFKWAGRCVDWKYKYPVVLPEYAKLEGAINSFHFIDMLSDRLPADAAVVTDMGTAFTGTFQAATMKLGQRWSTASGHAPMGYGLPGAIGAAYATGKRVICIVGDGGLQMNIQELATIRHNNLPILIFVLSNGGYLTIRHMQENHFAHYVGSEEGSGVWFPDVMAIGGAYDIEHACMVDHEALDDRLVWALAHKGPLLCEICMDPNQALIPRISSKKLPDGSIRSAPLEDMYPFLPRDEFNAQMIIPTVETLK